MDHDLIIVIVIAIYGPATIGWFTYRLIRRAISKRRQRLFDKARRVSRRQK